jgi:hypothetical protein
VRTSSSNCINIIANVRSVGTCVPPNEYRRTPCPSTGPGGTTGHPWSWLIRALCRAGEHGV